LRCAAPLRRLSAHRGLIFWSFSCVCIFPPFFSQIKNPPPHLRRVCETPWHFCDAFGQSRRSSDTGIPICSELSAAASVPPSLSFGHHNPYLLRFPVACGPVCNCVLFSPLQRFALSRPLYRFKCDPVGTSVKPASPLPPPRQNMAAAKVSSQVIDWSSVSCFPLFSQSVHPEIPSRRRCHQFGQRIFFLSSADGLKKTWESPTRPPLVSIFPLPLFCEQGKRTLVALDIFPLKAVRSPSRSARFFPFVPQGFRQLT